MEVQKQTKKVNKSQKKEEISQRKDLLENEKQEQLPQLELENLEEAWVAKYQEQENHQYRQLTQETEKEK